MEFKEFLANYRLVDLTHVLEEGTPCFLPYHHMAWVSRDMGDGYNAYVLQIPEHHGTHVDAPSHVGGRRWLDDVDLNVWHGPCQVINLEGKKSGEEVLAADIKKWEMTHDRLVRGDVVLLRYGWDKRWAVKNRRHNRRRLGSYLRDFPGLSEEAAAYLAGSQVRLVGTDTATVDSFSAFMRSQTLGKTEPAHIKLLRENDIPIVEGLRNLGRLPPKGAYFFAFPLSIKHGSGSPVRAVAFVPRER